MKSSEREMGWNKVKLDRLQSPKLPSGNRTNDAAQYSEREGHASPHRKHQQSAVVGVVAITLNRTSLDGFGEMGEFWEANLQPEAEPSE